MLEIKDLSRWLPQEVIEFYEGQGYRELYPPQAEAIERGLLEEKSMFLALATASGKTLLAELAMLKAALQSRRSLYIVPLRALAAEKFDSFQRFRRLGISVGISTGDFDKKDERLGRNQIIIATSEKADSLMRNASSWVRDLAVLVVDEIHLLNDVGRGPTLEMTITKLRHSNPGLQIIGLSATSANSRDLADWLDAELVSSDWRPIALKEGVICQGRLVFPEEERALEAKKEDKKDEAIALVRDTLSQDAQILIFENSRKNAEAAAIKMSNLIPLQPLSEALSESILATGESETCHRLASCVSRGIAFHHAGLLPEQRRLVEQGFRENKIKVIASTPTLAAGLNLPARRVLIKSYRRYEYGLGMVPIPVMEYRQMAGRAGRPGLDPYGESFLMAKNNSEMLNLKERYIEGSPEEIWSKLASESALRTHILSTIAAGFARTERELKDFIATTFYAHQQDPWHLDAALEKVLAFLADNGMIVDGPEGDLLPTRLGSLVSKLYIDPLSAVIMLENLGSGEGNGDRSKREGVARRPSDLSLLHLITMTPDMSLLYIQSADGWVEEFIDLNQKELYEEENYDYLLREAKTSAMLLDWIGEVREELISDRYRIGPGDIRRSAETAEWLMHSLAELSKHLDLGITYRAEQLSVRLHYGASQDLLTLLDLKGIGRVRARKLHQSGITNREGLRSADPAEVARLIGPKIAEKVLLQLDQEERAERAEGEKSMKEIGLTVPDEPPWGYDREGKGGGREEGKEAEANGDMRYQKTGHLQAQGELTAERKRAARRSKQGRLP
ncbi:ATP-dependent DNA helicase [Methanothrix sp.]|uniref:ATP-dependent DNA helicase n=1 Tax=Methanothrix sp. TaxID=90426 RepID=UPI003C711289